MSNQKFVKEINRLSGSFNQIVEINSIHSHPSPALFFIQSLPLLHKIQLLGSTFNQKEERMDRS
jgi:hypothetical protein